MALTHTDTPISTLKINKFATKADYDAAIAQGLITENELSFVEETIQANWTQSDTSAPDYIKNKPTIPTNSDFSLSGLSDTTISAASDGQILTYNGTSGKWENTSGSETPLQIVTFYYSNNNYACDTPISAIMQKLALDWEIRGQYVNMNANPIEGYEFCCTYGKGDFTNTNTVGNAVTFTADLGDSVVILTGAIAAGPTDTWTWEQIPQEKIKVINLTMTETQAGMTATSDTSVQDIHNYVVDGYLVFANASITGQPTKAMLPLIIDMSNNGIYVIGFKLFMLNEGVLVIGYSDGTNPDVWELDYNAEVYKCVFTNNNGTYSCSMDVSDVIDKSIEDHMYIFGVEQDSNDTYLKYYTFVGAHGDLLDEDAVNNYVEFSYTNGTSIEVVKGTITANGDSWVKTTTTIGSDEKLALSVVPDYLASDPSKDFSIIVTDNSDTPITTAKTRQYTKDLKLTIDNSEAEAILSVGGYYNIGKLKLEYQSSGGCTELATDHLWFNDSSNNIGLKLYTNVNEWTNYQHEIKIPYKSGTIALLSDIPGQSAAGVMRVFTVS